MNAATRHRSNFHWLGQIAFVWLTLIAACQTNAADSAKRPPARWLTLSGCRFLSEEHSDGDSFHVKYGNREFIFRLYFADAPETDPGLKDRIKEQCKYFGVKSEEILKTGEAAKKFTAETLKRSFTVTTRWQNAMGRSRLQRYYAQIDAGGQDLATLLVSRGLARAKGTLAILPDGTRAKDHMEKLHNIEAEAKARHVGIWAISRQAGK